MSSKEDSKEKTTLQLELKSSWKARYLIPVAEINQMVFGSKRWHACSTQESHSQEYSFSEVRITPQPVDRLGQNATHLNPQAQMNQTA